MPFAHIRRLAPLAATFAIAVFTGLVAFEPAVSAPVVRTWTGNGANNNWTTAANWDAGPPVEGDILIFPAVANRRANTNTFPNFTEFEQIVLEGAGYTLTGNRVVVHDFFTHNPGGGINTVNLIIDGDASLLQQSGRLELMAANSYAGNSIVSAGELYVGNALALGEFSSTLDIYGGVATIAAPGEYYQALDIGGAGAGLVVTENAEWWGPVQFFATLEFDIQQDTTLEIVAGISGGGAVTKSGGGTLYLSGDNTFTGVLDIAQGVVRASRSTSLGADAEGTVIGDGAVLELEGPVSIANEFIQVDGALHNASHINHLGRVLLGEQAEIRVTEGILRLQNGLDEALPGLVLTKTGGGLLELEGAGDFAGQIHLNEGEVATRGTVLADVRIQGGTLSGDGSVGDVEGIEGHVVPGIGNSETLTVGALDLSSEMWVDFVLDSGGQYTQIRANGPVSLDDPVLTVEGNGNVADGIGVKLLANESGSPIDGEFLLRPEGSTLGVGNTFFEITYKGGGDGHDFELIPESGGQDLDVTIVGSGAAAPAALYSFEVRIQNLGEDASDPVLLELIVPQGAQFVSSNGVICSFITEEDLGDIYDCAIPSIAAGATRDFDVVAAITVAAPPQVVFQASIEPQDGDPPANNATQHTVNVAPGGLGFRIGLPAVASDGSW